MLKILNKYNKLLLLFFFYYYYYYILILLLLLIIIIIKKNNKKKIEEDFHCIVRKLVNPSVKRQTRKLETERMLNVGAETFLEILDGLE